MERFEELTEEEITQIGQVTKKLQQAVHKILGASAYLLHQKNGVEVGQQVPHIHIHLIGRAKGEDSMLSFVFKIMMAQLRGALSQEKMQGIIDAMKKEMQ
jgi:diadenosine tetraphosphate (Ap4A) HIT family hydrolase